MLGGGSSSWGRKNTGLNPECANALGGDCWGQGSKLQPQKFSTGGLGLGERQRLGIYLRHRQGMAPCPLSSCHVPLHMPPTPAAPPTPHPGGSSGRMQCCPGLSQGETVWVGWGPRWAQSRPRAASPLGLMPPQRTPVGAGLAPGSHPSHLPASQSMACECEGCVRVCVVGVCVYQNPRSKKDPNSMSPNDATAAQPFARPSGARRGLRVTATLAPDAPAARSSQEGTLISVGCLRAYRDIYVSDRPEPHWAPLWAAPASASPLSLLRAGPSANTTDPPLG